jgi:hypothetical protein
MGLEDSEEGVGGFGRQQTGPYTVFQTMPCPSVETGAALRRNVVLKVQLYCAAPLICGAAILQSG